MIIQIGTEADESKILWKRKETDEWNRVDIDDLIRAYESRQDTDGDMISRTDAIEALLKAFSDSETVRVESGAYWHHGMVLSILKSLPSATCEDCIWHVCNYNKIDWEGEDGYISRQDALDKAILVPIAKVVTEDKVIYRRVVFVEDIESLPSVESKTGKWIRNDDYICDQCGYHMIVGGGAYNYCPNCGTRMTKGGEADE